MCKLNPNAQSIVSNFIKYNEKRREKGIKGENQFTKAKRLGLPIPEVSKETRLKQSMVWKDKKLSEEHTF